ncbi:MAG: bifunctional precorrin-2 dehydrogenase/sirohydrochlorin ferrochelatase [Eubacterium sp.]|nr:bifunctional precorrin-2 dehydrogenase/sirohydrochlorin ferrochelatase [Eubacterium sp.]
MSKKFPVFLDLSGRKLVVVGGGKIAERRIQTLAEFSDQITCLAPEATGKIRNLAEKGKIKWIREAYNRERIMDADMVLACTDSDSVNSDIYAACKALGILVNVCSDRRKCDFYFPGVVIRDNVVIGITASGENHHQAKEVREKIEAALDSDPGSMKEE